MRPAVEPNLRGANGRAKHRAAPHPRSRERRRREVHVTWKRLFGSTIRAEDHARRRKLREAFDAPSPPGTRADGGGVVHDLFNLGASGETLISTNKDAAIGESLTARHGDD